MQRVDISLTNHATIVLTRHRYSLAKKGSVMEEHLFNILFRINPDLQNMWQNLIKLG